MEKPGKSAIFVHRKKRLAMKYKLDENAACCLECGDPLPYGRSDRKFCCPACKNRHHNREARQWRSRYATVIGILQKNHDILNHLIQIGVKSPAVYFMQQQ